MLNSMIDEGFGDILDVSGKASPILSRDQTLVNTTPTRNSKGRYRG